MSRFACVVTAAVALSGCPHQEPIVDAAMPPIEDVGPPAPEFEGDIAFDDDATMLLDPTQLPAGAAACRAPLLARVTRDVDGDTMHVDGVSEAIGDLDIRFIGVNAPEIAHAPGEVPECYGDEATTFTTLLVGHLVWPTFDADCLDPYNRTLAYVYYGASATQSWERQLLRRGFAHTLTIAPNTSQRALFAADEAIAENEHVGLWSACP